MNRNDIMGRYVHIGGKKLENLIDFPIKTLDLNDYVIF